MGMKGEAVEKSLGVEWAQQRAVARTAVWRGGRVEGWGMGGFSRSGWSSCMGLRCVSLDEAFCRNTKGR